MHYQLSFVFSADYQALMGREPLVLQHSVKLSKNCFESCEVVRRRPLINPPLNKTPLISQLLRNKGFLLIAHFWDTCGEQDEEARSRLQSGRRPFGMIKSLRRGRKCPKFSSRLTARVPHRPLPVTIVGTHALQSPFLTLHHQKLTSTDFITKNNEFNGYFYRQKGGR